MPQQLKEAFQLSHRINPRSVIFQPITPIDPSTVGHELNRVILARRPDRDARPEILIITKATLIYRTNSAIVFEISFAKLKNSSQDHVTHRQLAGAYSNITCKPSTVFFPITFYCNFILIIFL